ncbi:polysaccharide pyruvyl transferase family protein [Marinilabiliaceae bacterium JC017]|nr:polysaccharide pyruvyl transferase family protein [Marinilabiliaceae bacterium JC017]
MRNVAILWADPYNTNLGVSALAYSTLMLVVDSLRASGEDVNISFVGSKYTKSDKIQLGDKEYKFETIEGLDYFKLKSLAKVILQNKRYKPRKLLGFDSIIDIGAGDSYSDIYGMVRFNRMFNSKRLFKMFGKKQLLLPQTIGPFENKRVQQKAMDILKSFAYVFARDEMSYNYAKRFISEEKLNESIDVAFYLPYEAYQFSKEKVHVGINVSGLLWNGGYTKNNQFNLVCNYQELIKNTIEYFLNKEECEVHLVGHVLPENDHVENDYAVCQKLKEGYKAVTMAPRFATPMEAKSYIAGLDFFTGARMHSTIAAFSSGVPVFPMAYSRKFNGLFINTLYYKWMGDCVNQDAESVFQGIIKAYKDRNLLKDAICDSHAKIISPRLIKLKQNLREFLVS